MRFEQVNQTMYVGIPETEEEAMKAIYTLNDFKVGDKVYLLPLNNAASRLHSVEELTQAIQEQTVTKVGSKYITVGEGWAKKRFEHHDNYDGLKEVSNYSPNYELYKNKEAAIAKITREDNVHFLRTYRFDTLSDEALEDIRGIIEALKEGKHGVKLMKDWQVK